MHVRAILEHLHAHKLQELEGLQHFTCSQVSSSLTTVKLLYEELMITKVLGQDQLLRVVIRHPIEQVNAMNRTKSKVMVVTTTSSH